MALVVNGQHVPDQVVLEAFVALSGGRLPHEVTASAPNKVSMMQRVAEERVLRTVLLQQLADEEQFAPSPQEIDAERRRRWGSTANETCGVGIHRQLEASLRVGNLVRHLTRHVPRPSRGEVDTYYAAHRPEFERPEQILAAHIVRFADSDAARAAARITLQAAEGELVAGQPFHRVAERYSDCKGTGGSIGWIGRGEMVEAFDNSVFALPKGARSPIFETSFGLHIAVVSDRRAAGLLRFDDVRNELAKRLHEARKQAALDKVVTQAMGQSRIERIAGSDRDAAQGEKTT